MCQACCLDNNNSGSVQEPHPELSFDPLPSCRPHQVNPPYYIPLVELVPHPETAPVTVDRTYALMQKIGQAPVRVLKEIEGFTLNRLQYAVISEAWRLVQVCGLRPPNGAGLSAGQKPG